MMPMQTSRKGCRIEKVENPTALQPRRRTCKKRDDKSDHACAIFANAATAEPARTFCRTPQRESVNCRQDQQTRHAGDTGHARGACAAVSHWPACTPCQI